MAGPSDIDWSRDRAEPRRLLAGGLREQAGWCRALGSPLYGQLLEHAARDVEAGGPTWHVLRGHERDPAGSALSLRLMGAVHRLVLEGRAPGLAAHFPSMGGTPSEGVIAAFDRVLEEQAHAIRELLDRRVQTNEVGRSAALLGGFLLVARETGLPLTLFEIGASAGLNLRWDHYRYEYTTGAWGDPASPVRFEETFVEGTPPLDAEVRVAGRFGCDLEPVDPTSPEGRLTLLSYVWPDQVGRLERLRGALEVAVRVPASVERSEATEWLAARLAQAQEGTAVVVFHSVVQSYLAPAARRTLRLMMEEAGGRASPAAPVAWLRMEHAGASSESPGAEPWTGPPDVRLTVWPGGEGRVIATCASHGPPVRWLGG